MAKRYELYKVLVIKELILRCLRARGKVVSIHPGVFKNMGMVSTVELATIKNILEELIAEGLGYKHITSTKTKYIFYKDLFLKKYANARTNQ